MNNGYAPALYTITLMICTLAGSQPATALDQPTSTAVGRLFMSPEERRALDAGRSTPGDPNNPDAVVHAPNNSRVVLNGVLKRSAGPDVVWINGQRAGSGTTPVQVRRGPDSQNTVTLVDPDAGRSIKLKPGQSWTP